MGVKGLCAFIKKNGDGSGLRQYPLDVLARKQWIVAVDASLIIHQTVAAVRASGRYYVNQNGEETSHLSGILKKLIKFFSLGIRTVFVFDGAPGKMKELTCSDRKSKQDAKLELLKELDETSAEYQKLYAASYSVSKTDENNLKTMLNLMGVPWIDSPEEADPVCAWLTTLRDDDGNRLVKGVCSDDTDMLPLGSKFLMKDMSKFLASGKNIEIVNTRKVIKGMGLTKEQFITACTLLGTDYAKNIPGIGPVGVWKAVSSGATLQEIIESKPNLDRKHAKCLKKVKKYFQTAVSDTDQYFNGTITGSFLQMRALKKEELIHYLSQKMDLELEKVNRLTLDLVNSLEHVQNGIFKKNKTVYCRD